MDWVSVLVLRPAVSVEEAAEIYAVSPGSIYKRVQAGTLKAVRHGRRLSIPTAQIRDELDIR